MNFLDAVMQLILFFFQITDSISEEMYQSGRCFIQSTTENVDLNSKFVL